MSEKRRTGGKPKAAKGAPARERSWAAHPALPLLPVLVAVAFAYGNSLDGSFVLDARALVLLNPRVQTATWDNVVALFSQDYWHVFGSGGLYRPATTLSYLVNYAVLGNGARTFGYHLTNLVLHLACVSLVYALVLRIDGRRWSAGAAAALFGLHPIATEAVAYIAGRADLLATLGMLAALLIHARGRPRIGSAVALGIAAFLALFAKESGLVLLAIMAAHDLLLGAKAGARKRYAIVFAIFVLYGAARVIVARGDLPVTDTPALDNPMVAVDPLTARVTAFSVIERVLALLVWPSRLSADYSCCEIPVVAWPPSTPDLARLAVSAAALLALAVWTVRQRARRPERCFYIALAVLAWLPASNLILTIGTPLAERTLYLPLAGIAALVAAALDDLRERAGPRGPLAVTAGLVAVLGAYGVRTHVRNEDWRDDLHLWSSALGAVPGSAKAHAALAATLFVEEGSTGDIDRVIALGERAIAIQPDYQNALVALGGHLVVKGDRLAASSPAEAKGVYQRAVEALERAKSLDDASIERFERRMAARGAGPGPDRADANLYNNLSLAYLRVGRLPDALAAYERSRDLDPLNASRQADVGVMLAELGSWDDAAIAYWTAFLLAPNDANAKLQLAEVYRHLPHEGASPIVESAGQVQISLDHPAVRRHRCRALDALVEPLAAAGRAADAAALRARRDADCPTALP